MIKNRYQAIGTSSKLRPQYEKIPYQVIKSNQGGAYYLQNIVSHSISRRHFDDLKPLKVAHKLEEELSVPPEIREIMFSLRLADLQEQFSFFTESEKPSRPVTRRQVAEMEDLDKLEAEDLEEFLKDFQEGDNKEVSWKN